MTPRSPVVSGKQAVAAFRELGYEVVRQRGSHVRMPHPDASQHRPLTVPLHPELRAGFLRAMIRDAGLTPDESRDLCDR